MDYPDYSSVKKLVKEYLIRFSDKFSLKEKDLGIELENCVNNLEYISKEVVDVVNELFFETTLLPNDNDVIEFMGFKLKLKRANPNIPIKLENASIAYSKGQEFSLTGKEDKEKKLERLSIEFYRTAHRAIDIAEKLPELKAFKARDIRIVRNKLIDHSDEKGGITHNSFSYSKNEGPYVKGLRVGNQLEHMDKGFKLNNENFINELFSVLSKAVNSI
ncbi:MAG: hypothetical protein RL292_495 [Candidatus Parcubacteria bacterium]|jgi:hypothetical protein